MWQRTPLARIAKFGKVPTAFSIAAMPRTVYIVAIHHAARLLDAGDLA